MRYFIALIAIAFTYEAGAMEKDRYMNDHDWYQFHQNRVYDASLSDQSRWEAAQLASSTFSQINPGSHISPHSIYRQGTSDIKYGSGEHSYYRHTGGNFNDYLNDPQFLPPLTSNRTNTATYYPYTSSPSVTYQSSRPSQTSGNSLLDDCRRVHQRDTGRNFDRDLEENCTIQ